MNKLTTKNLDHITRLIMKEVEFFNGWRVDDSAVETACFKAACRIDNYLTAKERRENDQQRTTTPATERRIDI